MLTIFPDQMKIIIKEMKKDSVPVVVLDVFSSVYVNSTREMVTHRRAANSVTSWHFHFRKDVQFSCG